MAIRVGHASIDENGKVAGGKVGDQTGKEICVRNWYDKQWNVYLECTDKALADAAARNMECVCVDNAYGYDQGQRLTGYNNIVKNLGRIHGANGEFDCSSLVLACYRLAGLNVNVSGTTRSMRQLLLATGKFKLHTDGTHLSKDNLAKRGGIYLREGSHVVMALDDGTGEIKSNPYVQPTRTIFYDAVNKKVVCRGDDVKWVQWELNEAGYKLTVDGAFGPASHKALMDYQDKNKLVVDGRCGPKVRLSLINSN